MGMARKELRYSRKYGTGSATTRGGNNRTIKGVVDATGWKRDGSTARCELIKDDDDDDRMKVSWTKLPVMYT